ncbi:poly [ADP-ribose] polymerase-like isoform X2 [Zootermopsis nevadensis]|uniref:poly [ADP-ribose] polymerase-like isoform X2 n=1 Tax=Zootermopsis nevadensis TaxID=136037 RepID=UPI000B8E78A2|nr:poly [ADP-ribose] polymerase-like isoform X2 [Zootermopsis nevadensis]
MHVTMGPSGRGELRKPWTEYGPESHRRRSFGTQVNTLKGEVRISKDFESENAKMYGGQERWYYVECFAELRDELEFWESGDCLPGIESLKEKDQQLVKNKLPKVEKRVSCTVEGKKKLMQLMIDQAHQRKWKSAMTILK